VKDQEQIEKLFDAYKAAIHAKDVDAFVSLYEKDLRAFDAWGRWSYDGADEWRAMADEWFRSVGSERVGVELDQIHTIVGDGVAAVHALVTFKGEGSDGNQPHSIDNRLTWVLRRADGGAWKIVHEHTSAPVDFETSKVIRHR
jgi:uncharacterized protein (TIGR02246 family)